MKTININLKIEVNITPSSEQVDIGQKVSAALLKAVEVVSSEVPVGPVQDMLHTESTDQQVNISLKL